MTPAPGGEAPASRRFRRVVVAFDWGSENVGAVEAATTLAARLRAELRAMFVEDIDLVRLAEHPRLCAFSTLSASGRDLTAEHLKRVLKLRLSRSQAAIEEAAARRQIKCAFEVRRGRLLTEAFSATTDDDLVIVSWEPAAGSPWGGSRTPPSVVARALSEARARSVLLLHPATPTAGPVLVAYDDTDAAKAALAAAAQIADQDGGVIEVALLSGRPSAADAWARSITNALAGSPIGVNFVHLPHSSLEGFCRLATRQRASLLVVGADLALAHDDGGRRALEGVGCSVLLVR